MPVSPASTTLRGGGALSGGNILTGGVTVESGTRFAFSNSTGSLSFPGGTLLRPGAILTFNVSAAAPARSFHFGVGPITNNAGMFILNTGEAGATLENDFIIFRGPGPAVIEINPYPMLRPSAVARFSGTLHLAGIVTFRGYTDSNPSRPPHEWAGPVIIQQDTNRHLGLFMYGDSYARSLVLSGDISDGPGDGTNVLVLSAYGPVGRLRLTGRNNTYARGTRIEPGFPFFVEVAPESSLGTGDLVVVGSVSLLGSRNLASNANVIMTGGGRVSIGSGVKIRLNSLRLAGNVFTNGLFTATTTAPFSPATVPSAFPPQISIPPSLSRIRSAAPPSSLVTRSPCAPVSQIRTVT